MRVKKNVVLILVVFLCALLPGCGSQTAEEAGDISSQAEQLLEVLCHQPYFERIDIKTNCSAKRADMIQRAARVMSQEPVSIAVEEGGLLKGEYYAVTHNVSSLIYYGDIKDNRPHGFGVVMEMVDDGENFLFRYIGNLKSGRPNGYGAEFSTNNAPTEVPGIEEENIELARTYLRNYLLYDGGWKNGKPSGEGNYYFWRGINNVPVVDGYWGGPYYPQQVTVGTFKSGGTRGKAKMYAYQTLVYDGGLKDGIQDGKGTQYYMNGEVEYKGNWKNGVYDGKGTLYDENGDKVYSGKWKDGDYAA